MYSKSVVGLANATAAGWGNLGGGVTNLVMPFVFSAIYNLLDGTPLDKEDRAWRYCYFLPVALGLGFGLGLGAWRYCYFLPVALCLAAGS